MSFEVLILGTAQDAGVPQFLCSCSNCSNEKCFCYVASIALIDHKNREIYLIDVSPDIKQQYNDYLKSYITKGYEIVAILLTHAHMGHIGGLFQLAKESSNLNVPIYAEISVINYLKTVFSIDHQLYKEIAPDTWSFPLENGKITAFCVDHRSDVADSKTIAFLIEIFPQFLGKSRYLKGTKIIYLPDLDIINDVVFKQLDMLKKSDILIIDGTFYDEEELKGIQRNRNDVVHPTMKDSCDKLQKYIDEGINISFTHLNHTNQTLDPNGESRRMIEDKGFYILNDGQIIEC